MRSINSNNPRPWLRLHKSHIVDAACLAGFVAVMFAQYTLLRNPDPHSESFAVKVMTPAEILKNDKFPELANLCQVMNGLMRDIEADPGGAKTALEVDAVGRLLPKAARESAYAEGEQELMLRRQVLINAAGILGVYTAPRSDQRSNAEQAVESAMRHLKAKPVDGRLLPEIKEAFYYPEAFAAGINAHPPVCVGKYGLR
jgi:hypothetical protein